ncbi:MAG: uracil-DNA glycosylase [Chloroflexota bacterium]|nr:uracil-DNA glycosylase [Chloroflexota bacterium]
MSELTDLYEQIRNCTKCPLHKSRTKAVPGEGPEDADIMFIGEAPGFHEDRQGRPFVGAAGRFLDELLEMIGLGREDVYICNVLKCRPPGNRDPRVDEIEACRPYLDRQIELIQPKMVVTLGRFSMARWFPNARISRIHGQPRKIDGVIYYPMYHPAAALHQPSLRDIVEEDMRRIPELIAQMDQIRDEEPPQQAQQLSLF